MRCPCLDKEARAAPFPGKARGGQTVLKHYLVQVLCKAAEMVYTLHDPNDYVKDREAFRMRHTRILIAVDLQKDFIDGSLGTAEAVAIVPAAAEKIRAFRAEGLPVVATLDTHGEDYLDTREGRFLPVVHCVRDTAGWLPDPRIAEALGDSPRLEKPGFGSMELPALVRELTGAEGDGAGLYIELIGLCTDICVVSNAMILKAAFPEADFAVDPACCAGVTPEKHRAALETMASCQIRIL